MSGPREGTPSTWARGLRVARAVRRAAPRICARGGGGQQSSVVSSKRRARASGRGALLALASFLVLGVSSRFARAELSGSEPAVSRVYAIASPTWIYPEPRRSPRPIGSIRLGQSVALRDSTPRRGPGCQGGFVAVEPFGHVCLGSTATLDGSSRYLTTMRGLAPRPGPLPFAYALSNGAPMYRRLPTRAERERAERTLGPAGTFAALSWGSRGHERLAEPRLLPALAPMPGFLAGGGAAISAQPRELIRKAIPLGSMLAYTTTFAHDGRTWLLSADGTVVPADRVRPFRTSQFAGVRLGDGVELPLAWVRGRSRPAYRREGAAELVPSGEEWPARAHVALDPAQPPVKGADGRRYLPTLARRGAISLWIAEVDATVVEPRRRLPWGVTTGDKWVEIRLGHGTLVAYEGTRPVFTTLISPGAGGVPRAGVDPVRASTTRLGVHRILYKYRTQTMSPERGEARGFWIADVPHVQHFSPPFALHTAYWHEDFGEPMSAGCVNVSPLDGAWLFAWTGPLVPPEWEGAAPHPLTGAATVIAVYR